MAERLFKIAAMFDDDANKYESFDKFTDEIRTAQDAGFEAIELSLIDPLGYTPAQMNKFLASINMPLANFLTGNNAVRDNIWFSSPDPECRKRAVERQCKLIPLAAEMNATMVIGTMQGRGLEPDYAKGKAHVIDCLRQIAEVAEKYNETIVLEPMNSIECGYHFTLDEVMETIRLIGSRCFKPMLDTVHMNIEEKDLISPFLRAGKELTHVHLCETNFGVPGTGKIDYELTFEVLKALGYDRYVTVKIAREPWPLGATLFIDFLKAKGLV